NLHAVLGQVLRDNVSQTVEAVTINGPPVDFGIKVYPKLIIRKPRAVGFRQFDFKPKCLTVHITAARIINAISSLLYLYVQKRKNALREGIEALRIVALNKKSTRHVQDSPYLITSAGWRGTVPSWKPPMLTLRPRFALQLAAHCLIS